MTNGRINDFYKQFEELNKKLDKLLIENQKQSITIYNLELEVKELTKMNEDKDKQIQELILEIERLKNNNNKNSSNSSKPSGTNGYKNVKLNNREKSNKSKGGQKGHKGKTLTQKEIEEMIEEGKIDEIIEIEENKNDNNKNKKPIIIYEYDIKILRIVKKHIIYPSNKIRKTSPVIYGSSIKSICSLLFIKGASMDTIESYIYEITNHSLKPTKSTICNWIFELGNILEETEYEQIKNKLLDSLVLNVDESPIKINGANYYINNVSNGEYTLQYITKHRNMEDIDEFGFLRQYKGILVHDHYKMYYNYGINNAECNVHTLRYLNAVSEFTNHKWAKELKSLFLEMKQKKESKIAVGEERISKELYNDFEKKYVEIIEKGKKERLKDLNSNAYKQEELALLNRLIKYKDNQLLFLKKFIVPFSNNRAEADLRQIKIRQKIGKFRSEDGAKNYSIIRSCTSTWNKNNEDLFSNIIKTFDTKKQISY